MKATTFENALQKDADYEAAIDGLMMKINRMRQEMQQSQQRIDKLTRRRKRSEDKRRTEM